MLNMASRVGNGRGLCGGSFRLRNCFPSVILAVVAAERLKSIPGLLQESVLGMT